MSRKLREVHVFTEENPAGSRLTLNDELTGIGVLVGFNIPVRAIFEEDNALQVMVLRRLITS